MIARPGVQVSRDGAAGGRSIIRGDVAMLAAAIVIFLAPTFIAPLTYPAFYEDESWIYLSSFEALRGNGLSLAALGEGQSYALIFSALMWPFVAISPLSPEHTIRLIQAGVSIGVLVLAFVISRHFAGSRAMLAPALLVMAPLTYATLRYGRVEGAAALLGLSGIALALSGAAFRAGLLSALSVCVHPIMIWIGPACAVAIAQKRGWRGIGAYTAGGVIGLAPQAFWMAFFSDVSTKYWSTSSLAPGRNALLSSLLDETQRFESYISGMSALDIAAQGALLGGLAIFGVAAARGWTRWTLILIAAGPFLSLALFSQGKYPYYFVTALPALAIAAAYGASRLPRVIGVSACVAALALALWQNLPTAWATRENAPVTTVTATLARELPQGAIVFSPLRYAGLVRDRPDLRFYSYHALYDARESTQMAACEAIDDHILGLAATDPRETKNGQPPAADAAYLVMYGMTWESYLSQVYHPDPPSFDCLLSGARTMRSTHAICAPDNRGCHDLEILRRSLLPAEGRAGD